MKSCTKKSKQSPRGKKLPQKTFPNPMAGGRSSPSSAASTCSPSSTHSTNSPSSASCGRPNCSCQVGWAEEVFEIGEINRGTILDACVENARLPVKSDPSRDNPGIRKILKTVQNPGTCASVSLPSLHQKVKNSLESQEEKLDDQEKLSKWILGGKLVQIGDLDFQQLVRFMQTNTPEFQRLRTGVSNCLYGEGKTWNCLGCDGSMESHALSVIDEMTFYVKNNNYIVITMTVIRGLFTDMILDFAQKMEAFQKKYTSLAYKITDAKELELTIAELKAQNEELKAQNEELKTQNADLNAHNLSLTSIKEELEGNLRKSQVESKSKQKHINKRENVIDTQRKEIAKQREIINKVSAQHKALSDQVKSLKKEPAPSQRSNNSSLETEIQQLKMQNEGLNNTRKQERDNFKAEIAQMHTALEKSKAEIAQMRTALENSKPVPPADTLISQIRQEEHLKAQQFLAQQVNSMAARAQAFVAHQVSAFQSQAEARAQAEREENANKLLRMESRRKDFQDTLRANLQLFTQRIQESQATMSSLESSIRNMMGSIGDEGSDVFEHHQLSPYVGASPKDPNIESEPPAYDESNDLQPGSPASSSPTSRDERAFHNHSPRNPPGAIGSERFNR